MTTQRQRLVYTVVSAILSVFLSCGFAVYYVTEQNKKWCTTFEILTEQNPADRPAPTTASGVVQQRQQIKTWNALRKQAKDFHCGDL
jgi:hypothetical protein